MYAIIQHGGHQYRVEKGATLEIDRNEAMPGSRLEFPSVLVYHDGEKVKVGTPIVEGVKVVAEVVKETRGEKLRVFKYIRREGYRNTVGHRQKYTLVKITDIVAK